jgi:hypothetical protein
MEATKVRLEAVAYLPGTDGSNPFPSSGESRANLKTTSTFRCGVARRGKPLTSGRRPFLTYCLF